MRTANLAEVAQQLTAPGKGLLASDESTPTIGKRLQKAGVENTEENRRDYRQLFYTAPGIGNSISGAILYKETLSQASSDGTPFVDCLQRQGILPGIKVDEGLQPMPNSPSETTTRGLDNLAANARTYHSQGARFAKWRAALRIGDGLPSDAAVEANAAELAQYAAICQATGLVPIVEPEILIEGGHDIGTAAAVSARVISRCIAHLWQQEALSLEAVLLKPQMCISGSEHSGAKAAPAEVAKHTLDVMRRCVPPAVPGIMFLSGGQSEEEATVNLNELNRLAGPSKPWALSFSYGRALQASVLKLWSADRSATQPAQQMAAALAAANGAATCGAYSGPHPSITSADSLRETFRGWGGGAAPA